MRHSSRPHVGLVGAAGGIAWWARHHMSPAVQAWCPGGGTRRQIGDLSVRIVGSGGPPIVLLHGLTSSGDQFGDAYDHLAEHRQVIVPDLLGFGRSLDLDRSDFSVEAHLRALDTVVDEVAGDPPLTVAGHSMGSIVHCAGQPRGPALPGSSPSARRCTNRRARPRATLPAWVRSRSCSRWRARWRAPPAS